jgi:hypothetical protein
MPGRKIILAFCLICLVSSGSRGQQSPPARPKPAAQGSAAPQPASPPAKPVGDASRAPQPVAPPPKPAADAPSLEVTMKFIQDKMSDIGPLTYSLGSRVIETNSGPDPILYSDELSNIMADPQRCTVSYHYHSASREEDPKPLDLDMVLDLKEVKKITVQPAEQSMNDMSAGKVVWTFRPAIFTVNVYQRDKKVNFFQLGDEELANRLARAINHAVELCTPDKKPEPF